MKVHNGEIERLHISVSGVLDQLNKLNPSKAQWPDGIPPWFINTYAAQLAPIFHNIFQLSVDSSQVPVLQKGQQDRGSKLSTNLNNICGI